MPLAYIGLGSNLGDRAAMLRKALASLEGYGIARVLRVSSFLETAPVGVTDQPDFLNAAAEIDTALPPCELLDALRQTERRLGRQPRRKWGEREIDLDLLIYGGHVIETPELTLPHPGIAEREFVLAPLAEIAPGLVHPRLNRTIRDLLDARAAAKTGA